MSRRSNVRKRQRQQARHLNRPKPTAKPVAPTRGLISEALEKLSPLALAIRNQERIQP